MKNKTMAQLPENVIKMIIMIMMMMMMMIITMITEVIVLSPLPVTFHTSR